MKKNIKYFIAGFLAASVIAAIPAMADMIDAFMNTARININGVDRVSWGEEMELDNGFIAPTSINYKDTLYLPMRKVSELSGKEVFWNGDTHTCSVVDSLVNKKVIAKYPDADGNLWEYATATTLDGSAYLVATDGDRGYTRVYRAASESVRVTAAGIYFMRLKEHNVAQNQGTVVKLSYDCTPDTQDGEALISLYPLMAGAVEFDRDYVFFAGTTPGNGSHAQITAYNYMTNEDARFDGESGSTIKDVTFTQSGNSSMIIEYTYIRENGNSYRMRTTFNKLAHSFSPSELVENEGDSNETK